MIFHKFVFNHIPLELPNEVIHQKSCTRSSTKSSTRFQLVNDITIKNKTFSNSFLSVPYHIGTVYRNIVEIYMNLLSLEPILCNISGQL